MAVSYPNAVPEDRQRGLLQAVDRQCRRSSALTRWDHSPVWVVTTPLEPTGVTSWIYGAYQFIAGTSTPAATTSMSRMECGGPMGAEETFGSYAVEWLDQRVDLARANYRALRLATFAAYRSDVRNGSASVDRHRERTPLARRTRPHPSDDRREGLPSDVLDHAIGRGRWPHREESLPDPRSRRRARRGVTDCHHGRSGCTGGTDAVTSPCRCCPGGVVSASKG